MKNNKKKKTKNRKKIIEKFLEYAKKETKLLQIRDLVISEDRFVEELIYPQKLEFFK